MRSRIEQAVSDAALGWGATKAHAEEVSRELMAAYMEPGRRYHTLAHVEHCLSEFARAERHAVHPDEVKWALLFHDAIYDPRRSDNEARSADWARSVMAQLRRPEDAQERVRRMILVTAHTAEPRTPDEALVLDIDLSILGADEATFDEYDRAVAKSTPMSPKRPTGWGAPRFSNCSPGASACFIPLPFAGVTRRARGRTSAAPSSGSGRRRAPTN